MVVLRGNDVTLHWTITKCLDGSEVPEDFSDADLSVFVITLFKRVRVTPLVEGNVIIISMPGNTQGTGKIGIEAVWGKNGGKNWSRAKQVDVLDITDDPRKITTCSGATVDNHVVEIASKLIGSVGYDGLTPEIINGSWWIGSLDTGVPATGDRGAPFTFDDFTTAQIDDLKRPAVEAGIKAEKDVVGFVNSAKEEVEDLRELTVSAVDSVGKVEEAISENEVQRVQIEQERVQKEQERRESEQGRADSEYTRVTAESARDQSETNRISAESNRASAEQLRVKAESNRAAEEVNRVSSEQEREKAESKRVADSSEAIKQCGAAAQGAKMQGDYAKEQGSAAKQIAELLQSTVDTISGELEGIKTHIGDIDTILDDINGELI